MDENFILELVAEGEKKFEVSVPLTMGFGDVLSNLQGTMGEVVSASDAWEDQGGLKTQIALEAEAWKGIFKRAYEVVARDPAAIVNSIGDGDNVKNLLDLTASGNKNMKHVHITGSEKGDALSLYVAFSVVTGPKFVSSVDFG